MSKLRKREDGEKNSKFCVRNSNYVVGKYPLRNICMTGILLTFIRVSSAISTRLGDCSAKDNVIEAAAKVIEIRVM